jgi:hypothetical protein
MVTRRKNNTLNTTEVAIVKAMIGRGGYQDQDIQAFFTRPTRTINHARIAEIRNETRHSRINASTDEELDQFLTDWPRYNLDTGLDTEGDELLLKSREAMIAAVHTFNSAGLTFKAELFIVSAIISWTYLMHAWFKREGIEYRHMKSGMVQTTREGADKYLELGALLRHNHSPISGGVKQNLEILLEIRHEIEHRSTSRIDSALSAKLQACCINYNDAIKEWFGRQCGLESRLSIALQFSTFDVGQRLALKKAALPAHIETSIDNFEAEMTKDEYRDPAYRYKVAFVPIVKSRESAADSAFEIVKRGSEMADEINSVILKEVDRARYTATDIVNAMHGLGYSRFQMTDHTKLWKSLNARQPNLNYGRTGDYRDSWVWHDSWLNRVKAHCEEKKKEYTPDPP